MVIRLPVIAATFMVASLNISMLLGFANPVSAQEIITCESHNNQRNTCLIPTRGRRGRVGRVRLVRQLSRASCRRNWGYTRNRIWVKNGCRAEFAVGRPRYDRY